VPDPSTELTRLSALEDFVRERIAPTVTSHGGLVEIVRFEADVVELALSGACSTCSLEVPTRVLPFCRREARPARGDARRAVDFGRSRTRRTSSPKSAVPTPQRPRGTCRSR
jgi:hypothetical protein